MGTLVAFIGMVGLILATFDLPHSTITALAVVDACRTGATTRVANPLG